MGFGREGRKVRLVPLERERHFDNCVRWLNDPQVTEWTLIGDFPLTRVAEQEFFDRVSKTDPQPPIITWAIETLTEEEEHIGICGLHDLDYRHGVGHAGIFIGRVPLWSRGFGTDAFATLTRYAFDVLGLRLVLSEAFAENERSVRMLRACGYREVGRIRARYWKRGAYRDMIQFALLREDWVAQADAPAGEAARGGTAADRARGGPTTPGAAPRGRKPRAAAPRRDVPGAAS